MNGVQDGDLRPTPAITVNRASSDDALEVVPSVIGGSGSVIGHAPIVSMPHWGGIISNGHLRDLVAYLKTLSSR